MGHEIRPGVRRLIWFPGRSPESRHADADEELESLIASRVERLVSEGIAPEDARDQALTRLGASVAEARQRLHTQVDRQERRMRISEWMESVWQDLSIAIRGARAQPVFAAVIVVTFALGLGVSIAMFGIVDRMLLRPPKYLIDPSAVHRVYVEHTRANGTRAIDTDMAYRTYLDLRAGTRSVSNLAAFASLRMAIGDGDNARIARVAIVTASVFPFFDARPVIGRFFGPDEDRAESPTAVAVLGYQYWQTAYGSRPDIVGVPLRVGLAQYRIIGVAPPGFEGVADVDAPAVLVPVTAYGAATNRGMIDDYSWTWLEVIVRGKTGVSPAAVAADVANGVRVSWVKARELNPNSGAATTVAPAASLGPLSLSRGPTASAETKILQWTMGVGLIVLIIAIANVANLLLVRSLRRRREMSVRRALGASRLRLVQQTLVETGLLAALGTAAALVAANAAAGGLRSLFIDRSDDWPVISDQRTLLFALGLGVAATLLSGLLPALNVTDRDLGGALKAGTRHLGYSTSRTRSLLLTIQTGLSVVLLVGAGLFVQSVRHVRSTPFGYDPQHLVYLEASMRGVPSTAEMDRQLTTRLADAARAVPGVIAVSPVASVPFWASDSRSLFVPGIDSVSKLGRFFIQAGSPDLFRTMNTRILRGRSFETSDGADAAPVVVVNEPMATVLWPGQNPLGRCIHLRSPTAPCATVVGVAEATKSRDITAAGEYMYYLPIEQFQQVFGEPMMIAMFARVRGPAESFLQPLRSQLQRQMPAPAYMNAKAFHEITDQRMRSWTTGARLFVAFGALALVLAAIGLYATISFNVTQRTQEIGVRLALGARARAIVGPIVAASLRTVAVGAALGIAVTLIGGRFLAPLLFHVSAHDPSIMAIVVGLLGMIGVAASLLPALRAVGLDPNRALRAE